MITITLIESEKAISVLYLYFFIILLSSKIM